MAAYIVFMTSHVQVSTKQIEGNKNLYEFWLTASGAQRLRG